MSEPARRYVLRTRWGAWRTIFVSLFFAWGGTGFAWLAIEAWTRLLSPSANAGVGVGTSSYVSALALVWIGGMILFGGAAALLSDTSDIADVTPEAPPHAPRESLPRTLWQEEDDRRSAALGRNGDRMT